MLWLTPAVVGDGNPVTVSVAAAAGFTVILVSLPVIEEVAVSELVIDSLPAVFKVVLKD